jgi:hypothetical protein
MQQPWFKAQFPGIFDGAGRLKMSPTGYNSEFQTFNGLAKMYNFALSRQQFGFALQHNIDRATFVDRVNAVHQVESHPEMFHQFEQTLIARGLAPKGGVPKSQLYDFAMGRAPKTWNNLWQEAYLRGTAATAGLVVGQNIQRSLIKSIIRNGSNDLFKNIQAGGSQAISDQFGKLATDLKTVAPASRLFADHGLTARDLATLEFGGPGQAEIALRAQAALASYTASSKPQATTTGNLIGRIAAPSKGPNSAGVQAPFPVP